MRRRHTESFRAIRHSPFITEVSMRLESIMKKQKIVEMSGKQQIKIIKIRQNFPNRQQILLFYKEITDYLNLQELILTFMVKVMTKLLYHHQTQNSKEQVGSKFLEKRIKDQIRQLGRQTQVRGMRKGKNRGWKLNNRNKKRKISQIFTIQIQRNRKGYTFQESLWITMKKPITSSFEYILRFLYFLDITHCIQFSFQKYQSMLDKVIDIYLTPRFWKGEIVYDGRRPLLVFQKPEQRIHINQEKPYPPNLTRKFGPEDGIIYELSELKNVKSQEKSIGIKMLVCVTMYNQPLEFLQRTLTGIYKNFIKLVNQRGMSSKDIAVVIIQDGILKLVTDKLHRKMSSSVRFFEKLDYSSGKSQCKLVSRINQILDEIEQLERSGLSSFVQKNGGLPPSVAKNISLLYQFQWKPSKQLQERYKLSQIEPEDPELRIMACFKHLNAKKLSSHLWFFQGFCRLLSPQFCTLMDVGTQPYDTGLIRFIEALESNQKLGGVSGFMTLDINVQSSQSMFQSQKQNKQSEDLNKKYPIEELCSPIPIVSTIFFILKFMLTKLFSCIWFCIVRFLIEFHDLFSAQRAQLFEYNFSHMFDKNFQSFFKYLNVLPGAWSAYRYEAISRGSRYQQNLLQKNYLKMVLDPEYTEKDYKQSNIYLAEDRILCLGIYCQKDQKFTLQYAPQALAKTDPMDNLIDLLIQRRRWINSSYFAFDYVYKNYDFEVRQSAHGCFNTNFMLPCVMYMSKLSIINTYFGPSIFFFALFTSTHQTYLKFKPPKDYIRSDPWVLVPAALCLGYLSAIIGLIIISLHKKANQFKDAYKALSAILGIYNLLLISIVVIYIVYNYFMGDQIPESAFLTRQIIKYLTIINFACLVIPIVLHIFTHPMRVIEMLDPRTFLSYLYYQAAYTHTFVIYAFSNVDDVTWGTKGVQQDKSKMLKTSLIQEQYYKSKLEFFGVWILSNAVICFLLIMINEVFVQQQNKAIILTAIGVYSTMIVVIKCIFGMLHHLRCMFLDLFCIRKIYYDEKEKNQMEKKLQKRKYVVRKKREKNQLARPSNAILPPDLFNDIYDEVKINGGSGRALFKQTNNINF